jgi:hypothetical protein
MAFEFLCSAVGGGSGGESDGGPSQNGLLAFVPGGGLKGLLLGEYGKEQRRQPGQGGEGLGLVEGLDEQTLWEHRAELIGESGLETCFEGRDELRALGNESARCEVGEAETFRGVKSDSRVQGVHRRGKVRRDDMLTGHL